MVRVETTMYEYMSMYSYVKRLGTNSGPGAWQSVKALIDTSFGPALRCVAVNK